MVRGDAPPQEVVAPTAMPSDKGSSDKEGSEWAAEQGVAGRTKAEWDFAVGKPASAYARDPQGTRQWWQKILV